MELEGPYLAFALFCERVLQEQDGVLSAIRIVDRLVVQKSPLAGKKKGGPDPIPVLPITMLIGLKSGGFGGVGMLSVRAIAPSGKEFPQRSEVMVELKGDDGGGANVIINANTSVKEDGVYWFDVLFENRLLTRMPLSVSRSEPQIATVEKPARKKSPPRSRRKS